VDEFYYRFPVGDRLDITLAANGLEADDLVTSTIVPFDTAVAEVGSPTFYDIGVGNDQGGAAGAVNLAITDQLIWDVGYVARNSNTATTGGSNNANLGGLFGAAGQQFFTQLNLLPDGSFQWRVGVSPLQLRGQSICQYLWGLGEFRHGSSDCRGLLRLYRGQRSISAVRPPTPTLGRRALRYPICFWKAHNWAFTTLSCPKEMPYPYVIEGYYEIPVSEFLTVTPAVIYGDLGYCRSQQYR
jgi:hypothetical protein